MALLTSVSTAVRSIWWFIATHAVQGFFLAFTLCDLWPYCIVLWANHRLKDPVIHALHAVWSLGVTIGPFFISSFLAKSSSPTQDIRQTTTDPGSATIQRYSWNVTHSSVTTWQVEQSYSSETLSPEPTLGLNTTEIASVQYEGLVQYSYVVFGLPLVLPAVLFTVMFLKTGVSKLRLKQMEGQRKQAVTDVKSPETPARKLPGKKERNILISLFIALFFFYGVVESVVMTFLTLFVTNLLDWPTPQRTLINSAFFGALTFGRIIGVPISAWLKPRTIMVVNLIISLSASCLFLACKQSDAVVWLAAGLIGFGISTMFGTISLWMATRMTLSNHKMGFVITCYSLGGVAGPFFVGQLFEAYTPMVVVSTIMGSTVASIGISVVLRVLETGRKRKENKEMTNDVKSFSDVEKIDPDLQHLRNNCNKGDDIEDI